MRGKKIKVSGNKNLFPGGQLRPNRLSAELGPIWGCGLLMAALLWAGLSASHLAAQNEGQGLPAAPEAASPGFLRVDPANVDDDGNRLPQDWAGLSVKKLERQLIAPDCPSNYQNFVYYYPQGFGSLVVDNEIERLVTERFNQAVEGRNQAGFCDKNNCGAASCGLWGTTRSFEVHRPSANFVSILFNDYSDTGGAHPNTVYEGLTYSLQTGRPMSLMELFPKAPESVPKYWKMVYQRWCENAGYKFPLHYQNSEPCDQPDSLANPNTFTWAENPSDLGRLVFTPHGASLVLGPYESGSNASGTVVLDFSKEEMIAVGASPSIWGQ